MSLKLEVGREYVNNNGCCVNIFAKSKSGYYIGEYALGGAIEIFYGNGSTPDGFLNNKLVKLKPKTIKVEKWINVYEDGTSVCYDSKEGADKYANFNKSRFIKQFHFCEVELPD